jgi:hypothetical protein
MEMNVKKSKVMRISKQPAPIHIMTDKKLLENVEYFNYWCSLTTNYERLKHEIKLRIAMAKAASNKKKTVFSSKLDLN